MVDCANGDYGNAGCKGGDQGFAFLYTDQQPLELLTDYPYASGKTGNETECNYNKSLGKVSAGGFSFVPIKNARAM